MQLQLLVTTACLAIYYDSRYNGLHLEWKGDLSLPAMQEACVAVAQCYRPRPYARVLHSNLQVTAVGERVGSWLEAEFLPYLALVGVEQVAWVSAPFLAGRHQVQTVVNRHPTLVINLFYTAEEAAAWLQQPPSAQVESQLLPSWQLATQVRRAQGVSAVRQEMRRGQQEVPHLPHKVGRKQLASA
jgi:hypothetical protein